jgi:hypothetical protein
MSSLAASLFGPQQKNVVLPNEDLTFKFTNPPQTATKVRVNVVENVDFLDGTASVKKRFVAGFLGNITAGDYVVEKLFGMPIPAIPDPNMYSIVHPSGRPRGRILAMMPEAERVLSHTLLLEIEGAVNGQRVTFEGQAPLHVEYPLAIVVPGGTAVLDNSLNFVSAWCRQWQKHNSTHRSLFPAPIKRVTPPIQTSHYDTLITAFESAAKAATSGVVVLAVGHGDAGDTHADPWCNITPEDEVVIVGQGINFSLFIDLNELTFGAQGPPNVPGARDKVKLNALDRMSDVATSNGVRRILIHTCRAGASATFMQLMADRLRVPVFAQTEQVQFTGVPGSGKMTSEYAGQTPTLPEAQRQLPVSRLGPLARPGSAPRRFAVP